MAKWTPEEDQIIRDAYVRGVKPAQVRELFPHRTKVAVEARVKKLRCGGKQSGGNLLIERRERTVDELRAYWRPLMPRIAAAAIAASEDRETKP